MSNDTTAVYMRVSTREQDVASQRRQIDQWLKTNGLTVADHRWYVDHGFSGKNLTRPHFMSLQSAIRHEQVRTVVVYLAVGVTIASMIVYLPRVRGVLRAEGGA